MPKTDLISLACDFCGNYDTIDVSKPAEEVMPIIAKWHGVMDGDSPPAQGADSHRWYDTLECLIAGERSHAAKKEEAAKKEAELTAQLERANKALQERGFMQKAADKVVAMGKA